MGYPVFNSPASEEPKTIDKKVMQSEPRRALMVDVVAGKSELAKRGRRRGNKFGPLIDRHIGGEIVNDFPSIPTTVINAEVLHCLYFFRSADALGGAS